MKKNRDDKTGDYANHQKSKNGNKWVILLHPDVTIRNNSKLQQFLYLLRKHNKIERIKMLGHLTGQTMMKIYRSFHHQNYRDSVPVIFKTFNNATKAVLKPFYFLDEAVEVVIKDIGQGADFIKLPMAFWKKVRGVVA